MFSAELERVRFELRVAFQKFDEKSVLRFLREAKQFTEEELRDPQVLAVVTFISERTPDLTAFFDPRDIPTSEVLLIIDDMRRYAAHRILDALATRGERDERLS